MSQASADTAPKARKGAAAKAPAKAKPKPRPTSPHLQVWRWHVTMLGSLLHRVSGVALYIGAFVVVGWLTALAMGAETYTVFLTYAASPWALILWVGFSGAAFYHLFSGLRHLVWDTGLGLSLKVANALTTLSIWLAVIATVAFWAALYFTGRISL